MPDGSLNKEISEVITKSGLNHERNCVVGGGPTKLRFWGSDLLTIGLIVFIAYIFQSLIPFYSTRVALILFGSGAIFLLLSIKSPLFGFALLLVSSPFFGNHPGGRFIEIFDLLMLLWIAAAGIHTRRIETYTFCQKLEWLFLFCGLLSFLANPYLVRAMANFALKPYFILTSNEGSAMYPLKMFFATFFCIYASLLFYRLYIKEGRRALDYLFYGALIAVSLAVAIGIMELLFPSFAAVLDQYHLAIGKYKDKSIALRIFSIFDGLLPATSMQSLFWNRGWFAVSLFASLPFMGYIFHRFLVANFVKKGHRTLGFLVWAMAFLFILNLVGARGAYVSFAAFFFFYLLLDLVPNHRRIYQWRNVIPAIILGILIVIPILLLLDDKRFKHEPRRSHFANGIAIWIENPLFGGGIEGYGWHNEYSLAVRGFKSEFGTAHNQLLQELSGKGLVGTSVYLAIIFFALKRLLIHISLDSNRRTIPLFAGFIGILVYSCFQEWFYLRAVGLFWWLLIMVIFLLTDEKPVSETA